MMSDDNSTDLNRVDKTELNPLRFQWKPLVIISVVLGLAFAAVTWYGYSDFTDNEMKAAGKMYTPANADSPFEIAIF